MEVGFLFNQQPTTLEISGTRTVDVGEISVRNYHGYVAYNFLPPEDRMRPYLLLGLGATEYGSLDVMFNGTQRSISGNSKFSPTMGAGLKVFPRPRFGLRLEGRFTPTYIKSDTEGWWCDPYWGCYTVEDPQYANQLEFSAGAILRF